jgi:acetyltransferase-like isoleucine patch superfamily enzyme
MLIRDVTLHVIRTIERVLASNPVTEAILFNDITGSIGRFFESARYRQEYARYRERYDIHPEFQFNGPGITMYGDGTIDLGENSYIGRHSRIQAMDGQRVRIGANTAVSHFVFCYTRNWVADQDMRGPDADAADGAGPADTLALSTPKDALATTEGDTIVGNNCWIGASVFLTEGVSVGDNTVVGANAVVTDSLPPHCVAAGTPARVQKFKSYLSDEQRNELADEYADVLAADLAERHRKADSSQ